MMTIPEAIGFCPEGHWESSFIILRIILQRPLMLTHKVIPVELKLGKCHVTTLDYWSNTARRTSLSHTHMLLHTRSFNELIWMLIGSWEDVVNLAAQHEVSLFSMRHLPSMYLVRRGILFMIEEGVIFFIRVYRRLGIGIHCTWLGYPPARLFAIKHATLPYWVSKIVKLTYIHCSSLFFSVAGWSYLRATFPFCPTTSDALCTKRHPEINYWDRGSKS